MEMAVLLLIILLVYLFAIMPRVTKRSSWNSDHVEKGSFDHSVPALLAGTEYQKNFASSNRMYYAHRGLHDNRSDAPENSMKAFQKAVDAGYGIEFDVQLTKDRIPVVFHDATLKRVCQAPGKVRDYTYKELQQFNLYESQERIPKLEDFLKLVDGKVPLIIEIKIHENAAEVCKKADELIRDYKGIYCVESFHPLAVRWYKKNRPEVIRGQLSSNFRKSEKKEPFTHWLVHQLLTNVLTRPDFIAYDHRYKGNLSRVLCRRLFGVLSAAWTVKSQKDLDACRADYDLFIFEGFIPDNRCQREERI